MARIPGSELDLSLPFPNGKILEYHACTRRAHLAIVAAHFPDRGPLGETVVWTYNIQCPGFSSGVYVSHGQSYEDRVKKAMQDKIDLYG